MDARYAGVQLVFPTTYLDDGFFLLRALNSEMKAIQNILTRYEADSGQVINCHKSDTFFSQNVSQPEKDSITQHLGITIPLDTGRYLGLPSLISKCKR